MQRHVGCFPVSGECARQRYCHDRETGRKMEGAARVASAAFARRRAIAPARSRVNARRLLNRQPIADGELLFRPVMIFPRPWIVWRFREITGEFFFVRTPRTGYAPLARRERLNSEACSGRLSGPKSPVPKGQAIDSARDCALLNFSRLQRRIVAINARAGDAIGLSVPVRRRIVSPPKNVPREEALPGTNTGGITGTITGLESPVMARQAIEFARNFFRRKNFTAKSRRRMMPASASRNSDLVFSSAVNGRRKKKTVRPLLWSYFTSTGTPGSCLLDRMTSAVFTLATFFAAVSVSVMKDWNADRFSATHLRR